MRKQYLLIALAFAAVFATPVAAGYTVGGIDFGSAQSDSIFALLIAAFVIYDIMKNKKGTTGAVVLSMFVGAFMRGGLNSVEKVMSMTVGAALIQTWFDSKEDKTGLAGDGIRIALGFGLGNKIASGMDPMTAFLGTIVSYMILNTITTLFSRKETLEAGLHLAYETDKNGNITDNKAEGFWKKLLGNKGGGSGSGHSEVGESAVEAADKLKKVYVNTKVTS